MQEKITVGAAAWRTLKETYSNVGLIVGIFFATVTLLNWVHSWLGIQFIPPFELAINGIRDFLHFLLDLIFFRWLALAFNWLWYVVTLLLSTFSPILPFLPDYRVPGWYADAALLSIALLRVFESAYLVVPRSERDAAYDETTEEQYRAIDQAQGIFWGRIHSFTHTVNAWLWNLTDYIRKRILRSGQSRIVRLIVIEVLGGLLMWGFVRLLGYSVNVPLTLNVEAPVLEARRKTFFVFGVCLCTAMLGVVLVYVTSGLLMPYVPNQP